MKKRIACVIFKTSLSKKERRTLQSVLQKGVVIAPIELQSEIQTLGHEWISLNSLIETESIHEARVFLEELSRLTLKDGTSITKIFTYKEYELWWMYYQKIFLYLCMPYTQYRKLLHYLRSFDCVYVCEPPYRDLFSFYFQAYEIDVHMLHCTDVKKKVRLPLGVVLQIGITLVSLPFLILRKTSLMVFTGDIIEKNRDYDFRMKYIYEDLRTRCIPFIEFIRSLESWKTVLSHAFVRRRPVVYTEAITFAARGMGVITGGRRRVKHALYSRIFEPPIDPETRFRLLLASQFLLDVQNDVWAIRITKWILQVIGIRAAYITASNDRNFDTVIACKLLAIPTVGILHGFASYNYNVYDFLPTYSGTQSLSVDTYGLWSEWWKEYYLEHGKAYTEAQLVVSGPMRPLKNKESVQFKQHICGPLKVLFVSEQLAVPEEVLPYLMQLLATKDVIVYIKFRPYRDGFEMWLKQYHPEVLAMIDETRILRGEMQEAIALSDVVVGSHSTAVLEALLVGKPVTFFATHKWGDYFSLQGYHPRFSFYAENEDVFIKNIQRSPDIPRDILVDLEKRFFGDAYQNGSRWVVDQLSIHLGNTYSGKDNLIVTLK